MTSVGMSLRTGNPYVGPTSFRLGDPLYGREREQADLLGNYIPPYAYAQMQVLDVDRQRRDLVRQFARLELDD